MIDYYSICGYADVRGIEVPNLPIAEICRKVSNDYDLPIIKTGIEMDGYMEAYHSFALSIAFSDKYDGDL